MARYSPMVGAAFSCAAPGSRELNIMVLERERADPFTRRIEEGVEYRWRGNADGRFADPTPEAATWHDEGLDLGHLSDAASES